MTPEQEQELERTSALRGFRYGVHDFLAEVDLDGLRRMNDMVEAEYLKPELLDRKTKEVAIIAAGMAVADEASHLQIHMHAAVKAGMTKEEIWALINLLVVWCPATGKMKAMEAFRLTFYPELPPIERVSDLR